MSTRKSKTRIEQQCRYILQLRECAGNFTNQVGSKAANLAKLLEAGFPVPDGFVVTADAFQEVMANIAGGPDHLEQAIPTLPLPPGIRSDLLAAIASLGDVTVAVRSSGIAEDLPGASFAGQYETILGVQGTEAVLAAVQRCWASAFNKRVTAYRDAQGIKGALRMAVLVQQLVVADTAGVAFTANPVTGDRTETVVSAVRGLGDRLVSGEVTPEEWSIKNDKAICKPGGDKVIGSTLAKQIAGMAKRVEKYFGSPQDIEWAQAGDKLYILQARPITTLASKTQPLATLLVKPPPGFWERETSHYPRPISPMFQYFFVPIQNASFKDYFDQISLLVDTIEWKDIGGWMYRRVVPFGGKDRPAPPAWLMWLVVHFAPRIRSRIKGSLRARQSDISGSYIERWHGEWKARLIARINELRQIRVASLDDKALEEHITRALDFLKEGTDIHFHLDGPVLSLLSELAFTCRDLLGWDDNRTMDLLCGLSEKSSEPSLRLAQLALMARRPTVSRLLEHIDDRTVERLAEADKEFAAAFLAYQEEFGCRALSYEVAEPTVSETPVLVLGLVRDQLLRGYDPSSDAIALAQKRATIIAEARAALSTNPTADREKFERALARAERAYPVREDNEFYTQSCPFAMVRYALLELGDRLAKRGQIAEAEDVFFLKLEEARAAFRNHEQKGELVAYRKAEKAWVETHPGPASYGKSSGLPPLGVLPPEVRLIMERALWSIDRVYSQPVRQQGDKGMLRGIAASAGQYTGPARVVMNESEFHKVRTGDVLVCPITSPVWSVLFPSIGALVTDAGGILCHSAIIAREYRVPAVVATGNATSVIYDGQQVTVDGGAGLIKATL